MIALPARSQTVTRDVTLADTTVPMSMTSTGIGASLFAVGVAQLPPAIAGSADKRQQALASLRDSLVRNINGSIVNSSPAALDSQSVVAAEAVEATGRDAGGRTVRLTARFFVADDKLYQVVALGGEGEIPAEALDTFFTSFRLTQ
ncbi:MAG: hypothetical protein ACRECQ_06180 [Burkholderiaceae bacterium]